MIAWRVAMQCKIAITSFDQSRKKYTENLSAYTTNIFVCAFDYRDLKANLNKRNWYKKHDQNE